MLKSTVHDMKEPSRAEKLFSAGFFGLTSIAVIFINKHVLTAYKFPLYSVLATAQFAGTTFVLTTLMLLKKIEVTKLSREVFFEVFPISVLFLLNVLSGLGGTGSLNIPLRRFGIMMTLIGEYVVLHKNTTMTIFLSVLLMVIGSFVAAVHDLTFDLKGYVLVTLNNIFTALSALYLKKASTGGKCNKMSVLYYNSMFSFLMMSLYFVVEHSYYWIQLIQDEQISSNNNNSNNNNLLYSIFRKKVHTSSTIELAYEYEYWNEGNFIMFFILSSLTGSLLNYATFLCTTSNSPLTTSVIGCLKNVLCTYMSMLFLNDYAFEIFNFIGLNISIIGSIVYTYVALYDNQ